MRLLLNTVLEPGNVQRLGALPPTLDKLDDPDLEVIVRRRPDHPLRDAPCVSIPGLDTDWQEGAWTIEATR